MTQTNSIAGLAPNRTVANHPAQSPEREQGQSLGAVAEAHSLSRLGLALGKRIGRSAWIHLDSNPGDTSTPSPAPGVYYVCRLYSKFMEQLKSSCCSLDSPLLHVLLIIPLISARFPRQKGLEKNVTLIAQT